MSILPVPSPAVAHYPATPVEIPTDAAQWPAWTDHTAAWPVQPSAGLLSLAHARVLRSQRRLAALWDSGAHDADLAFAFRREADALQALAVAIADEAGVTLGPIDDRQRQRTTRPIASVIEGGAVYLLVGCDADDFGAVPVAPGETVKAVVVELG